MLLLKLGMNFRGSKIAGEILILMILNMVLEVKAITIIE